MPPGRSHGRGGLTCPRHDRPNADRSGVRGDVDDHGRRCRVNGVRSVPARHDDLVGNYEVRDASRYQDGYLIAGLARELHAAGLPLNTRSNVYENARFVKGGPGFLFGFTVYNSKGSGQFIQWHDSATLPAEGAVPEGFISVATVADRTVQWLPLGRAFQRGIYLVNSSTGPTKTIGSADCFFDVQYI